MTVPTDHHDIAEIREWILGRLAVYLERPASDIDPAVPLVRYGLDSLYAVAFCGDVEDHFGLVVEETLAWDHPTVDRMSAHLRERLAAGGRA